MGNVLIIKNNSKSSDMYKHANQSYKSGEMRYYIARDGSSNENNLIEIKDKCKDEEDDENIVLFLTYEDAKKQIIDDIFIGDRVEITDKNNINYIMRLHLNRQNHERTIDSIIDKIDLDINLDFNSDTYVIMSDMDSLYEELKERITEDNEELSSGDIQNCESDDEDYKLHKLAQRDAQAVRVYENDDIGEYRIQF